MAQAYLTKPRARPSRPEPVRLSIPRAANDNFAVPRAANDNVASYRAAPKSGVSPFRVGRIARFGFGAIPALILSAETEPLWDLAGPLQTDETQFQNEAGWAEYVCSTDGAVSGSIHLGYNFGTNALRTITPYCLAGQTLGPNGELGDSVGYWRRYRTPLNPTPRYAHRRTYVRGSAPAEPRPGYRTYRDLKPVKGGAVALPKPLPAVSVPQVVTRGAFGPKVVPVSGVVYPPAPVLEPPRAQPEPGGAMSPEPVSRPSRPARGVKETKVAMTGVLRLISDVTETLDVLDAAHKALPKGCKARPVWVPGDTQVRWDQSGRPMRKNFNWRKVAHYSRNGRRYFKWERQVGQYRQPSPQEKLAAVYNCAEGLDVGQFLINVVMDQIEDAVYAQLRAGNRGRPIGFETGPAV